MHGLFLALAVTLQIQITLSIGGGEIRVSLADLLLVPAFAIAALLVWGRANDMSWRVPALWLWIAALTAILFASLVHGWGVLEFWSGWALYNKFVGWFVLIAYLMLGAVAAADPAWRDGFLRAFFMTGWLSAGLSLACIAFSPLIGRYIDGFLIESGRIIGLLANPNAFGYLLGILFALQAPFLKSRRMFSARIHVIGASIALAGLIVTGSRGAWLGLIVAIPALALLRVIEFRRYAAIMPLALALVGSTVLVYALLAQWGLNSYAYRPFFAFGLWQYDPALLPPGASSAFNPFVPNTGPGRTLYQRLDLAIAALDQWRAHPAFGTGLGVFLEAQRSGALVVVKFNGDVVPQVIHSTPLWLLTETGLLGLVVFGGFFFVVMSALWIRNPISPPDLLRAGVFGAMTVFAGLSLSIEAMYQRHLWFLLGLALAIPALQKPRKSV
ncbi:MAG: O-antigen ligase family protein [Rhodospirillales bacterium]|nr:O-antigen ligase family protein [Rhodospirillales bacterium]